MLRRDRRARRRGGILQRSASQHHAGPALRFRPRDRFSVEPSSSPRHDRIHPRRGGAGLRRFQISAERESGYSPTDPRQHQAGDRVDADPGSHSGFHRRADGEDDLHHPGAGGARLAQHRRHRPPMVVGIQISRVRSHHGERDLHSGRAHREFQTSLGRRYSLVLDSAARWQARRRDEPHELPLVHARQLDRE